MEGHNLHVLDDIYLKSTVVIFVYNMSLTLYIFR